MKRFLSIVAVAAIMLAAAPVWAEHGGHGTQCSTCQRGGGGTQEYKCPITDKIMGKAKFLLSNAEAIGLTDEQVRQIKAIKHAAKKAYIRMDAEMQIFEIDVNAKMSESTLDVDGLNAMMDRAGAGMSTGAKAMIADYAKLKAVLTDVQMAKAKDLWKQSQ